MKNLKALVLASDKPNRMCSEIPVAFHKIIGKSILRVCVDALKKLGDVEIIIMGDAREEIEGVVFAGSGGIKDGLKYIADGDTVIVLNADMPLITNEVLCELMEDYEKSNDDITALFGADMREQGVYCFSAEALREVVSCGQCEYKPLHDILWEGDIAVTKTGSSDFGSFLVVRDREDMCRATALLSERINRLHMERGVTFVDMYNSFIGPDVNIGNETVIYPGCFIEGATSIGGFCEIGPNSKLRDVVIGDHTNVVSSIAYESEIGSFCEVGPFAYMRPGSKIGDHVKIGDFVEVKNSVIGNNTKASHLAYIGDADVGNNINIGCGTITVNYDGKKKHRTIIEDGAFIGSNTNLVAPVVIGEGATVAAGSTITKDVPPMALGIARERQVNKDNWRKP